MIILQSHGKMLNIGGKKLGTSLVVLLNPDEIYTVPSNKSIVNFKFIGSTDTSATIVISGSNFTISNSGGSFIWDLNGDYQNEFTIPNEVTTFTFNNKLIKITYKGDFVFFINDMGTYTTDYEIYNLFDSLIINSPTIGGFSRKYITNTTTLVGSTTTILTNIPINSKIIGVELLVTTGITSDIGTSWTAAFIGGFTSDITSGNTSFALNTNVSKVYPDQIINSVANILITCNTGTFTDGVIKSIVYYEEILNS